jgi:exosome complex component RRP41
MPIGYMPNLEKITLLQLDGVLSPEEFKKCVETGIHGCKIVYELQKKALQEKYFQNGGNQ